MDFAKAVKIAIETEDAAKVAKETVYGSKPRPVNKVKMNNKGGRPKNHQQSNSTTSDSAKCYRLDVPVTIQDQQFTMELDTATTGNFVSVPVWKQLGKPKLDDVTHRYESASKHDLPVLGTFMGQTKDPVTGKQSSIPYIVTKIHDLNLLGRNAEDPVIATVMRYVREGWPLKHAEINEDVRKFQKLSDSLSICHGCLIYGTRVVIPQSLQPKILDLLHIGHFGMERMKQLARTAVYWPGIDAAIEMTSRRCDSCGEHQNKPSKPPVHPWMLPEKPWSRVHLDHAINFMGTNWLVITDAYSKYPCIHPTSSTSTRATLDLLEEDFAHFGYPHTLVSDNATTFVSEEFQSWCKERGITHLTGAPYHPATNGAAERLVQTFKQALGKSSLPPKRALQEFLMQYRRMPTSCGFSPSELLMSRQIRTRIDTLLPSPAHIAQGKQSKEASKTQVTPDSGGVAKVTRQYKAGDPVYALYYGPHHAKQPRWVPAVVKKSTGTRCFNVKVVPRGPVWRRHWEQLRPRYASEEDNEPGDSADASELPIDHPMEILENVPPTQNQSRPRLPRTKPPVPERKSGKRRGRDMNEQESDEEELDDDDYDAPTNFKKIKIFVKSLRADSVISSALDISRNRVDEIFFGSRLRVNGDKLLKKSKQLDEGDYVDLVVDRSADVEDHVLVKRVKIIEEELRKRSWCKTGASMLMDASSIPSLA
nr:hypothetical protein BaRGS_002623 [Batillaria attramentaria]